MVTVELFGPGGASVSRVEARGPDARSWHFPDMASGHLRPGSRHVLEFEESSPSGPRRIRAGKMAG